jgi:hypothetical protein
MIRGTTAQFKFKLPYSYSELEWITITFWQPGNPNLSPIIKRKTECSPVAGTTEICTSLTCEDTAKFSDRLKAKVQLRAQPIEILHEAPFGCKEQFITVYPMLDDLIKDDNDVPVEPPVPPISNEPVKFDGGAII